MNLPAPLGEQDALAEFKTMMGQNKVYRSHIGAGYYPNYTPNVILRNILENPGTFIVATFCVWTRWNGVGFARVRRHPNSRVWHVCRSTPFLNRLVHSLHSLSGRGCTGSFGDVIELSDDDLRFDWSASRQCIPSR